MTLTDMLRRAAQTTSVVAPSLVCLTTPAGASTSAAATSQKSANRLEVSVVWVRQPDQVTCGPTTAKMILQTLGVTKSVDELKPYVEFKPGSGTYRDGMARGLNKLQNHHIYRVRSADNGAARSDTRAFLLRTAVEDLSSGFPIALSFYARLPGYPEKVDHWVVIAGVDVNDRSVHIIDPAAEHPNGWEKVPRDRWINVDQIPFIKAIVS